MTTWIGVDPALGGGCACIVVQPTPKKLHVIDLKVDYGLGQTEQILERITNLARRYHPSLVIIEADAQQKAIGRDERLQATAAMLGFHIQDHTTRGKKHYDPVYHVAAMNQSFVAQQISIPWADEETKRAMEPLREQLLRWRPDIPTKKLRQDAVMALWFVWRHWMIVRHGSQEAQPQMPRPSYARELARTFR